MRPLLFVFALAGCATAALNRSAEAEERLARELAGRSPGEPVACIPARVGTALAVVSSDTLVYRGVGTIWVNRLGRACPGLSEHDTLLVETHGNQDGRGDRVRGLQPGSTIPGPVCPLGSFTPYG